MAGRPSLSFLRFLPDSSPSGIFHSLGKQTRHGGRFFGAALGKVLAAYIPGRLERAFEEFARLPLEQGESPNRSLGRGRAVAEINEKYNSKFVVPPL
jgi:hypothetical protein